MSYAAAIDQLNAMVPELHTVAGHERRKFSLDEVRILLAELGDPQKRLPSVLIAGTNGKGSTASTLASILTASGTRTGLYTSPHLVRVNERIRLDREEIPDQTFAELFFRVHDTAQKLVRTGRLPQLPSFFEILTAQAFLYFAEVGVGIAVLEVGMGGRLDATNVVDPLLSIITDISLDHMEWLGNTIAAITREKAGILRRGGTLVTLPQHAEANQVLGEVAAELDVRAMSAAPFMSSIAENGPYCIQAMGTQVMVDSPLRGAHQRRNLALATAAAVELAAQHGFPITPASLAEGIRTTCWPARLERIASGGTEWILDVAHNPAGAWALRSGLNEALGDRGPRALVFSCLRDKPLREMAQILFPIFDEVVFAPIHSVRATSLADLMSAAQEMGVKARAAESVSEALRLAAERTPHGVVVVSGSVYLVGEARPLLLEGSQQA